ncbi:ASI1-immunoprecipitated protein 1-like [Quercus suber]|uniref:ASI1-immunoprecipitated protein 1-like n=1 Tax=Quercus suber TaxID=58331 RepID=UPI0032E0152D
MRIGGDGAKENMFDDRPKMPSRTIQCQWLDANDPQQLQEEERLAKHQQDILNANYKKHEVIDNIMVNGTARRLADRYNL